MEATGESPIEAPWKNWRWSSVVLGSLQRVPHVFIRKLSTPVPCSCGFVHVFFQMPGGELWRSVG